MARSKNSTCGATEDGKLVDALLIGADLGESNDQVEEVLVIRRVAHEGREPQERVEVVVGQAIGIFSGSRGPLVIARTGRPPF